MDTQQKKDILIITRIFTVMGVFVALCIWNRLLGFGLFIIFLVFIFFVALFKTAGLDKKSRDFIDKQNDLYGKNQAPNFDSFYFGSFYNDEGELDINKVREGIKIISNGEIEIPNSVFENKEKNMQRAYMSDYVIENLSNKNYAADLDIKAELKDLVYFINKVIDKKKLPINKLTSEEIMSFDSNLIKNRRKDKIVTTDNDVNVAHDIIEKQGYELINVLSDEYCLTIVNNDDFQKLKTIEGI